MAKTTIEGWSLEKHSEFVKQLKPKNKIFATPQKTLKDSLSEALGYKTDPLKETNQKMVKWMGKEDSWYKYKERDFE